MTGALNDEVLRDLFDRLTYLRNLTERQEADIASIEEQGKLTLELKEAVLAAKTLTEVEDLYLPYRPKKRTRATIAKEKGLEPFANTILLQLLDHAAEEEAEKYLDPEKGVETTADAIGGAKDILAEFFSENADYRKLIRSLTPERVRENCKALREYFGCYESGRATDAVCDYVMNCLGGPARR